MKEEYARHARRPPGPPPGPFPFTTPQPPPGLPSTALAIPNPHTGASSAASASPSSGGDINVDRSEDLEHVVERLQQEMREMREQIALLESAVRGILIQNALPEQWERRRS